MPSLLFLALIIGSVAAMSAPVQKIVKPAQKNEAAASPFGGFMEGIGFGNFFQDVGVEKAGSTLGLTKKMPAASSIFPSIGGNTFAQPMVSPSQLTEEQVAAQKERGFMPASPFGSPSNQASNIVPPAVFQQSGSNKFGSFKFPQAFHNDFGAFANNFGSSRPAKPQAKEETEREESPSNRVAVEHKPRGRPEPRHRSTRNTQIKNSFFGDQELFPSSSNKEEKKTNEKCTIVHKDGMDCEVCNDGEGGFSEHCSQSHNSGQDRKFTSSSKSKDKPVKHEEKKKEEEKAPSESKDTKSVPQKQASKQSAKSAYKPPTFDFHFPSHDKSDEQKHEVKSIPSTSSSANPNYERQKPQIIYVIVKPDYRNADAGHANVNSEHQEEPVKSASTENKNHKVEQVASEYGKEQQQPESVHHNDKQTSDSAAKVSVPQPSQKLYRHEPPQPESQKRESEQAGTKSDDIVSKPAKAVDNNAEKETSSKKEPFLIDLETVTAILEQLRLASNNKHEAADYAGDVKKADDGQKKEKQQNNQIYEDNNVKVDEKKNEKKKNNFGFGKDDFNFSDDYKSFGGHPRAQSSRQSIYEKNYDPFENFHTDHLDPFADGTNADPYKFEVPVFDSIDFQFGPESHRKLVEKSGLYKKQPSEENKVKSKESPKTSSSQRNAVAKENLYKKKEDKDDKEDLGKLVKDFTQKKRENCKMEIREGMTCYVCKDKYGKSDEECMFASKDPNNQHMMYSEASSYGSAPK